MRKVDYELGRFTTLDPLWKKYYAWSPYQYSMNNPISLMDENGGVVIATEAKMQETVIESVEPKYRQYLSFNGDGVLQVNQPGPVPINEGFLSHATMTGTFDPSSEFVLAFFSTFM